MAATVWKTACSITGVYVFWDLMILILVILDISQKMQL